MSYLNTRKKLREFNPLPECKKDKLDLIINYTVFFQTEGPLYRRNKTAEKDFEEFVENLNTLKNQQITIKEDFQIELVISINGHITAEPFIKYLKEIDDTVIGQNIHIVVHQRQNIGYRWGAFHDVWLRYKNVECPWWLSLESDIYFHSDLWYDIFVENITKSKGNVGWLGPVVNKKSKRTRNGFWVVPQKMLEKYKPECYRDGNNKPLEKMSLEDTMAVGGGFSFCKKEFLQHMDDVFGCFTTSMGNNYDLDGIILGEIGFSQKTRVLGYHLFDKDNGFMMRRGV